ncbi:MAG: branched-chain amino acid ABC transporter permease [Chloroflexi bacterium]|nr:branched-chain amino acid ABC transporter permease [Chloroflexota bacterium]MCY4105322.1 branched-chain amino acid ABC transporter permease [Chloroflexota bacterium]
MRLFIQFTMTGISEGALLALIALGLVLIYKSTDVLNFAHGEFMLLGAFITWDLMVNYQLPVLLALPLAGAIMILVAIAVERLMLRPLIGKPVISIIMVTIGMSSVIHAIVGAIWGPKRQVLPQLFPEILEGPGLRIFVEGVRRPAQMSYERIYWVLVAIVLVLLFVLFFRRSRQGIAMRATADDQQAAMSMGISIQRIFAITWSVAALTAGVSGLMVADFDTVSTSINEVVLRAFPVIILGGLDSIAGAIIGGMIIALTEQYVSGFIDPSLKNVVPYLVLLLVLMARPYGLFGEKIIERV